MSTIELRAALRRGWGRWSRWAAALGAAGALAAFPGASGAQRVEDAAFSWPATAPGLGSHLPLPSPDSPTGPSFAWVAGGTLLGGAAGALGGAGLGYLVGGLVDDDDFEIVPARAIVSVLGAGIAYPIGAAVGARRAATVAGVPPGWGRVLGTSLVSAAAGLGIWVGVGDGFDDEGSGEGGLTSWYIGASLGFVTHLTATTVAARWGRGDR